LNNDNTGAHSSSNSLPVMHVLANVNCLWNEPGQQLQRVFTTTTDIQQLHKTVFSFQTAVHLYQTIRCHCGTGSVVGIATGYGLEGPVMESQWWARFSALVQDRPWGPPSLLCNGYRVFPGGKKRPGRDADPSSPSSAVVIKE
jgi:hypothetical protein